MVKSFHDYKAQKQQENEEKLDAFISSKTDIQAALLAAGINHGATDRADIDKLRTENKKLKLDAYRAQKIVMKQMASMSTSQRAIFMSSLNSS